MMLNNLVITSSSMQQQHLTRLSLAHPDTVVLLCEFAIRRAIYTIA